MITRLLVANRGEIAIRIMRACEELGIATVAVYSELDRDALHVKRAGEAYLLGGPTAAESYLDVDKIIAVIAESGAEAVHPGYGFLAENADFAQAVLDAGLVWIGPPPAAITALGDKVQARHIAQKVGAPLVPGTADPGAVDALPTTRPPTAVVLGGPGWAHVELPARAQLARDLPEALDLVVAATGS